MKLFTLSTLLLPASYFLLHPSFFVLGQECYYPNGDPATSDDHPCSSDGHSLCCPLNWQCLSNGLCYLESEGYLGRYTCTDPTWKSDSCPKICLYGGTAAGNEAIQECSQGSFCCDTNRPEVGCCQTTNDFFALPDGIVIASIGADGPLPPLSSIEGLPPSTAASDPSTISTATFERNTATDSTSQGTSKNSEPDVAQSSSTIASSPSGTTNPITDKLSITSSPALISSVILVTSVIINSAGVSFTSITSQILAPQTTTSSTPVASTHSPSASNLGMKIGLGVGIPVGVIALALLGFFLLRRRRNKGQKPPPSTEKSQTMGPTPIDYMYKGNGDADSPLTATTASPELNQRASSKYVVSEAGDGGYRGVKTGSHGGLGLNPGSSPLPNSPTRSELSGDPSIPRDYRNSQMSELAASLHQPSELPARPFR